MTAPTTSTTQQAAAAAAAYEAQQDQLRAQLVTALLAIWATTAAASTLPSPAAIARLIARMAPVILGAQQAMTAMVTAELQRQTPPLPGRPITVDPRRIVGRELRGGVPIETVYHRPFNEVGRQLAEGKPTPKAWEIGADRLTKTALTDLQLAQTHTARDYGTQLEQRLQPTAQPTQPAQGQPGAQPSTQRPAEPVGGEIVGFRRVLSSKPNHCALCILASTQRYHSFDLMPIHPGCGCRVAMIIGDRDPGQVLDENLVIGLHDIIRRDLGETYVDPGGRKGLAHYRDILVTNEHGEIGPVLGVRGQKFTGPDLVPRLPKARINPPGEGPND